MDRATILFSVFAGGMVVAGAPAQAQQGRQPEGPVVVGTQRESWKGFELERFNAAFEFQGQYRNDRLRDSSGTFVERESLLREMLDLSGEAAIGHKNLIDLSGQAQFGLDYRTTSSDVAQQTSREWDFLNLYDLRATLLGNGPVPTTLYTHRDESVIDRGFGSRVDQTMNESGAIVQMRSEVAPTTLQYFHRRLELSDAFNQSNSTTDQDTFTGQSGIHLAANQRLDIAYTYDNIHEEQPGFYSDRFDRHDANIVHTLDFGGESRRHELRSSLRIYDQTGQFSQRDTRLDELLVLHHSDRLETRYNATVDQQTRSGLDQELYRGEASIRHRLYDSLISSASVGTQHLSAPDNFTSDDVFGSGQFDYTKKVPLGRFNAAAGISYDAQDNSERGSPALITNESQVFNDPLPITLSRRNIVQGSIILFPPVGFPPYREGIDYTVRYFGDRAEVSVPPGSAIQNGQTVLANYAVGPEPGNQIDTLGTTLSARYTLTETALRGLSVYSMYRTLDQELQSGDPGLFVLDDSRDLLMGIEYGRAGLNLKAEHEKRWSTLNPYESDRLQAMYTQILGRDSALNLEYSHESITYPAESDRLDFDRLTGRWNQRLTPSFDFNVRLEYRNERERQNGNTEAYDQILGFTWHKAQTTIYFSVQNTFLRGDSSDRTSQFFQLGLRREF